VPPKQNGKILGTDRGNRTFNKQISVSAKATARLYSLILALGPCAASISSWHSQASFICFDKQRLSVDNERRGWLRGRKVLARSCKIHSFSM